MLQIFYNKNILFKKQKNNENHGIFNEEVISDENAFENLKDAVTAQIDINDENSSNESDESVDLGIAQAVSDSNIKDIIIDNELDYENRDDQSMEVDLQQEIQLDQSMEVDLPKEVSAFDKELEITADELHKDLDKLHEIQEILENDRVASKKLLDGLNNLIEGLYGEKGNIQINTDQISHIIDDKVEKIESDIRVIEESEKLEQVMDVGYDIGNANLDIVNDLDLDGLSIEEKLAAASKDIEELEEEEKYNKAVKEMAANAEMDFFNNELNERIEQNMLKEVQAVSDDFSELRHARMDFDDHLDFSLDKILDKEMTADDVKKFFNSDEKGFEDNIEKVEEIKELMSDVAKVNNKIQAGEELNMSDKVTLIAFDRVASKGTKMINDTVNRLVENGEALIDVEFQKVLDHLQADPKRFENTFKKMGEIVESRSRELVAKVGISDDVIKNLKNSFSAENVSEKDMSFVQKLEAGVGNSPEKAGMGR